MARATELFFFFVYFWTGFCPSFVLSVSAAGKHPHPLFPRWRALTEPLRHKSLRLMSNTSTNFFVFPPPTDRPTDRSRFLNLKFFFPKYLQGKWASLSKDTHLVSNTKGWKFEIRILEQERIMWRGKKMSVTFFQCFSFPALSIELFDYENFQSMNFDESVVVDKVRWTDWF